MLSSSPLIYIDSREKNPWQFPLARVSVKNLQKYGYDYTISGGQSVIGIERKTLADFYSRVSTKRAWELFCKNQLRKLAKLKHRLIIVEGSPHVKQTYSEMPREALMERVAEILICFDIPVLFASNRTLASEAAYQFLLKAWNLYRRKD